MAREDLPGRLEEECDSDDDESPTTIVAFEEICIGPVILFSVERLADQLKLSLRRCLVASEFR